MIGPNGSGKTTLLEIIAGRATPDSGTISRRKGTTIGYLEQEITPFSQRSLLEEVVSASSAMSIAHRIELLEEELAEAEAGEERESLLQELGELHHRLQASDGYNAEVEARINHHLLFFENKL